MIDNPPDWLREWSRQIGAELKDGLRESPSWIAFARENGTVYHTYTVMAPDPVRRALLQLPARANAEGPTRRAPYVAQGRVPGCYGRLTVRHPSACSQAYRTHRYSGRVAFPPKDDGVG
jgi:hypothetical protein